jgi:amino acid transporter
MELEDLKSLWKENSQDFAQNELPAEALEQLLRGKTHGIVRLIKRNLVLEAVFCVLITLLILGMPMRAQQFYNLELGLKTSMVLYTLFIVGAYGYSYRWLQKHYDLATDLKTATQSLVQQMERSLRLFFYTNVVLTPIALVSGGIYGYTADMPPEMLESPLFEQSLWWLVLVLTIVGIVSTYPLNRYYLRLMYGKSLEKLKAVLQEFDEAAE